MVGSEEHPFAYVIPEVYALKSHLVSGKSRLQKKICAQTQIPPVIFFDPLCQHLLLLSLEFSISERNWGAYVICRLI